MQRDRPRDPGEAPKLDKGGAFSEQDLSIKAESVGSQGKIPTDSELAPQKGEDAFNLRDRRRSLVAALSPQDKVSLILSTKNLVVVGIAFELLKPRELELLPEADKAALFEHMRDFVRKGSAKHGLQVLASLRYDMQIYNRDDMHFVTEKRIRLMSGLQEFRSALVDFVAESAETLTRLTSRLLTEKREQLVRRALAAAYPETFELTAYAYALRIKHEKRPRPKREYAWKSADALIVNCDELPAELQGNSRLTSLISRLTQRKIMHSVSIGPSGRRRDSVHGSSPYAYEPPTWPRLSSAPTER